VPYVAYKDWLSGGRASVKKFNGTNWVDVGTPGFSTGEADYTSIAIGSNDNPVVIYSSADAFAKTIIESTLPLHFVEFKGQLLKNNALLSWKTDNEESTKEFIVERSVDGRKYSNVGTVAAMNTEGIHRYNFTDNGITAFGADVVYYRLKQKDIDDKVTNSRIVALPVGKQTTTIVVYGNPVYSEANLTVTVDKPQQVQAGIVDNTGRIMQSYKWNLSEGSTALSIDMTRMTQGVYYLVIKGSSMNKQVRLIKQ
jgi:hypothetical protein